MDKHVELPKLLSKVAELKLKGQKVVFTNGCFDLLHAGHIVFLKKAKALGSFLIVGLNSDASVARLKGKSRPIFTEKNRLIMLSAISYVDALIIFEEDTPSRLITVLKPDVLVKGKDYKISNIAGADVVLRNGGVVRTIELKPGLSTTSIIETIKLK